MREEKLTWVKYAISPVALVDSETWEETPISSDEVVYINDEEFDEITSKLRDAKVELVCLAGFMRILSPVFVNRYLGKLINIHPSLLPKYKGLDTHKRVLENNEEYHGVTVHFVDNTLDGGPICAQSSLKVETKDIDELQRAIHELEHELYPWVINQIANKKIFLSFPV